MLQKRESNCNQKKLTQRLCCKKQPIEALKASQSSKFCIFSSIPLIISRQTSLTPFPLLNSETTGKRNNRLYEILVKKKGNNYAVFSLHNAQKAYNIRSKGRLYYAFEIKINQALEFRLKTAQRPRFFASAENNDSHSYVKCFKTQIWGVFTW